MGGGYRTFHDAAGGSRNTWLSRGRAHEPASRTAGRPIADLAAVVTVTDDGGSSGRLRREYRILPPGDIRNCMVALSQDELLLSKLFQYRFPAGRGLAGHSFRQSFSDGADEHLRRFPEGRADVRASPGDSRAHFPFDRAERDPRSGTRRRLHGKGETKISRSRKPISRVRLVPRRVRPMPEVLRRSARPI